MSGSWDQAVFDRIYAGADDPWDFQGSAYEQAKYAATLAALGVRRFANALEVGCSIGVQTRLLAARCDRLLGLDVAPEAVRRARLRCADLPQVEIRQARVPRDWPEGGFDLIVFSEVLYFLDRNDIRLVACRVLGSLRPGGVVLLVNWTGQTDTPTTGDEAAACFLIHTADRLRTAMRQRDATYRLDVFTAAE